MEKKVSLKLNLVYQMFYEVLVLCLPLITSPYISRVLGAENLGIYSYTYSIATYFGMFAVLGVRNHGNREIAKSRSDQDKINHTFSNIYTVQLIASTFVFVIYLGYALFIAADYKIFFLIQGFYVLSCLLDISWFFTGLEQIKLTVIRSTVIKILAFVATFMFVRDVSDLWKYCLIVAFSAFLSQAALWTYFPRYAKLVKPNITEVKRQLKPMLILFIPVIAVSIYNVMDKIMVGSLSTKTQLGYYENSEKIINCTKTVITSFGAVMMPRMSRLAAEKNVQQSKRYMRLSIEAVMFIAFALAFGIGSIANDFSVLYWGEEFAPCGILLMGLAVSLAFSGFANVVRTQYLIPNNKDTTYITAVISGAVINAVVNVLLIPSQGAFGAVIGTICAEAAVCVIQCFSARKEIELGVYIKKTVPFLVIGAVMCLCVISLDRVLNMSLIMNLLIEIVVGASVYLTLSLVYFAATKNEILESVVKIIKKQKK
ncbi:MAG: oligosaccharide flippase family protein [Ruminococcus sp.]|nr:oligosaccharide flippase family protein [Ruminococcus sp.]